MPILAKTNCGKYALHTNPPSPFGWLDIVWNTITIFEELNRTVQNQFVSLFTTIIARSVNLLTISNVLVWFLVKTMSQTSHDLTIYLLKRMQLWKPFPRISPTLTFFFTAPFLKNGKKSVRFCQLRVLFFDLLSISSVFFSCISNHRESVGRRNWSKVTILL
jgi:hypothetical protein